MRKGVLFKIFLLLLCVGALMLAPVQAQVEEPGADQGWQFAASIYLWGAGIDGKTQSDTEVRVDFDDILDNLEMAFMGAFGARKGKWSLLADVIYLDVGAAKTSNVTIPIGPGIVVSTGADLDLTGWVLQFAGGYNLLTKGGSNLDLVAGARYLDLQMDLALSSQAIQARYRTLSASNSVSPTTSMSGPANRTSPGRPLGASAFGLPSGSMWLSCIGTSPGISSRIGSSTT
jgi:hypothetical protein